jgi:hypothetical protein
MSAWEAAGKSDEWFTPRYIFDAMMPVEFDLDVAAPMDGPRHVPTRFWRYTNSLEEFWAGFVWMNPPYGARNGLAPWLDKFIAHGNGICLVPDRTSAPWFQAAAPKMEAALFVSPKIQFERPDGTLGKSPGTGSVLFAIGRKGCEALERAKGLGWYVRCR